MTIFLFSAPISCEGEKEEKLLRNNYELHLTNDTLSEMTDSRRLSHNNITRPFKTSRIWLFLILTTKDTKIHEVIIKYYFSGSNRVSKLLTTRPLRYYSAELRRGCFNIDVCCLGALVFNLLISYLCYVGLATCMFDGHIYQIAVGI